MFILLIITVVVLIISLILDKNKTVAGIKSGWKMFLKILPALLNILILVSIILYLLPSQTISHWLGRGSGFTGMAIAAIIGSISLIPGFIAFPLASLLLKSGVAYSVIAVFITTLMMVGVVTLPLEAKYFGWRVAILRNGLSFIGALFIGVIIGLLM